MAKNTLYNFNASNPADIQREEYTDVGSSAFILGDVKRGFKGGSDLEIWTAAVGGTQLVENTDYTLSGIDSRLTTKAGFNVYTLVTVTNATYQTGNIYITYDAVGSFTDADTINTLITDTATNTTNIATNTANIATNTAAISTLAGVKNLTSTDSPYTITNAETFSIYICDTSSGNIVVNLPDLASNHNEEYKIVHAKQSSSNTVTINRSGSNTITQDDLTSIILPVYNNFVQVIASDQTGKWEITDENITSQLKIDTYAGYGSTDTKIMRFTNSRENIGNMFTENHSTGYNSNTEGLQITITRSGKYSFNFSSGVGVGQTQIGLSLNSSELTTDINTINVQDRLIFEIGDPSANASGMSANWTGYLENGDIVRAHTNGLALSTAAQAHFTATYIGS